MAELMRRIRSPLDAMMGEQKATASKPDWPWWLIAFFVTASAFVSYGIVFQFAVND